MRSRPPLILPSTKGDTKKATNQRSTEAGTTVDCDYSDGIITTMDEVTIGPAPGLSMTGNPTSIRVSCCHNSNKEHRAMFDIQY
jgi:hypothetical protein